MQAIVREIPEVSIEQKSKELIARTEQEKYWDVVNLIAKMIVDQTLSHDNEKSDPLPAVQQ